MIDNSFFLNLSYPHDNKFSIIIEDDGKVAYAYLLEKNTIIGDVWLYNNLPAPMTVDWKNVDEMPFLNPASFIREDIKMNPIQKKTDVDVQWETINDKSNIRAKIFIRGDLISIVSKGSKPGWSVLVSKDGPVAKKLMV